MHAHSTKNIESVIYLLKWNCKVRQSGRTDYSIHGNERDEVTLRNIFGRCVVLESLLNLRKSKEQFSSCSCYDILQRIWYIVLIDPQSLSKPIYICLSVYLSVRFIFLCSMYRSKFSGYFDEILGRQTSFVQRRTLLTIIRIGPLFRPLST